MNENVQKIKAALGFTRMSDVELLKRLDAIRDGMTGNAAFLNPPVDIAVFTTAVETFDALVTRALDGGKTAISAKRKQRQVVIRLAVQLGHYVEGASNNDPVVFHTSGFEARTSSRVPAQPLTDGSIKYVDRGPNSGQLVVRPVPQKGALTFDLRYCPVPAAGAEPDWKWLTLPGSKPVTVSGLTPGTTYQFQLRAFGRRGHSDWGGVVTFICA
jgi:hypothetical protein